MGSVGKASVPCQGRTGLARDITSGLALHITPLPPFLAGGTTFSCMTVDIRALTRGFHVKFGVSLSGELLHPRDMPRAATPVITRRRQ